MQFIIERKRVVRTVVVPEYIPALRLLGHVPQVDAAGFGRVVIFAAEVDSPANAVGFEHEATHIHVPVVDTWRTQFHADEPGVRISPPRTHDAHRCIAASGPERLLRSDGFFHRCACPPDQHGRKHAVLQVFLRCVALQNRHLLAEYRRVLRLAVEPERGR